MDGAGYMSEALPRSLCPWFFARLLFAIAESIETGTSFKMWCTVSSVAAIAALAGVVSGQVDGQTSPPSYPSPWMRGGDGWDAAYKKAQAFVSGLTLLEKVNLTTGVGWQGVFS